MHVGALLGQDSWSAEQHNECLGRILGRCKLSHNLASKFAFARFAATFFTFSYSSLHLLIFVVLSETTIKPPLLHDSNTVPSETNTINSKATDPLNKIIPHFE
jgi:hypothetical protein